MAVQSDYRYSLTVSGEKTFDVVSFVLQESLSHPFCLELELASFESAVDFGAILDKGATLTFWQNNQPVRYVNGIVTALVQGETGFARTRYKMVVEPSLVRARYQSDNKIFQQKNTEEILRTLLSKNHISHFEFHLSDAYWQREYCVQYRETDLAFIERLAAEEGTYYYFEHNADNHILHFCNNTALSQEKGTLLYNPTPAGERPAPALWQWAFEQRLGTTTQTLRDYTFTHPTYSQQHQFSAETPTVFGDNTVNHYEKYDYPGRYKKDAQGKPFTQYRLEYERREAELAQATGDDLRVIPGYCFSLTEHPRAEFNRTWLVIAVEHRGYQTGVLEEEAGDTGNRYENHLKLIPSQTQWRPTPQPRPKVDGPQIAHVVGPSGEEIYCDEWGRVKIQFPWDRIGEQNETSSCWVRVSQAWAGAQFGNIAIPRIGHEVIVDFLEGDPDQPIITGRTYHSTTEPPYALPEHKTIMSIKSKTHKGNGFNELRFEDEKGQEEVFIHAERDQNNVVNHDETTQIGNDRTEQVGRDETIHIGNNRTETVGVDEEINIGQDKQLHIGRNRITKVEKDEVLNIGNNYSIDVYATQNVKNGRDHNHQISRNSQVKVGTKVKQHTKNMQMTGTTHIKVLGQAGTMIIDGNGITLKGKVTIKGSLAIISGNPDSPEVISFASNDSEPGCEVCEAMKNKQ